MGTLDGKFDQRRRQAGEKANNRETPEVKGFLGEFAYANLSGMNPDQLALFEKLLDKPDTELRDWITDPSSIGDADLAPLVKDIRTFNGIGV